MLIELTQLPRSGAEFNPPARTVGVNPETISSATPAELPGWGSATQLDHDGEVLFVSESVAEVVRRCNQAMQICLGQGNFDTA